MTVPASLFSLQSPEKALLAAFRGDLPATLLAEQFGRATRYLAEQREWEVTHMQEDLLQVQRCYIIDYLPACDYPDIVIRKHKSELQLKSLSK